MKNFITLLLAGLLAFCSRAQQIIIAQPATGAFPLAGITICVDPADDELVQQSAILLQRDIEMVTGEKPRIAAATSENSAIVIGSLGKSAMLQSALSAAALKIDSIKDKWEAFIIKAVGNKLIIAGSDRRGTAYGVLKISRQLGVSPWYWWADVPVLKRQGLYIKTNRMISDAPKVKYRGIFINDEAPALSNWSREKFGGFNSKFYEKVFELILRLKGNYLWPAMWGNAFYDDDSLNIRMADRYGIVIGTSHHEPLMRAHDEWRRYGAGKWNYDSNEVRLKQFWRNGMQRATNEKIVSVGMRGDGDEPMSRETATALLERIVRDQRSIISEVTGKPAQQTPQLWALYKEVQDYYEKGMRVPDDVTLLLCDDNWGNIRKLPKPGDPKRNGGYGIYYHFDYVGGPRNYKWLNTNPLPRIWEQMRLAWDHQAKEIWIVNVGDIKPMEFPISFFLDYAWNPEAIGADELQRYSEGWAAAQFGAKHAPQIADILTKYGKYSSRRKPELLDANTYNLNNGEWKSVVDEYRNLLNEASVIGKALPTKYSDAYFQLVLHPVKAIANLYEMYYNVALNKKAKEMKWISANDYAKRVRELYINDSLITKAYHTLNNGKWNHMMSQTHIGYTYWQQPLVQKMPDVYMVNADSSVAEIKSPPVLSKKASLPSGLSGNIFYQEAAKGVSIGADHFTRMRDNGFVKWLKLPDHGRTGSAMTVLPSTAKEIQLGDDSPYLEYEVYTYSSGDFSIHTYHSPSLNLLGNEQGLQYAVSVDDEQPQIMSINKEDRNSISGIWNKWVSENIIVKSTLHKVSKPGKHIIRYWMVNPALVLQKIVLDFGDTEKSYLGPAETIFNSYKKRPYGK